ncbi:MAG: tripartite tricarboxylate transporter permease [Oscillospiraceae bacterium]
MQLFIEGLISVCTPFNLVIMLIGTALGILFGALPGITATLGVALCLPLTFGMEPIQGFAMLCALYIGGTSGGLISAILLNIPGTGSSVATTFDGHPMSKNGQSGKALGIGVVFSFFGTLISIAVLIFLAPQIAKIAVKFGAKEYFALSFFSLTMICSLSGKSLFRGLVSGTLGMTLAMVGAAPIDGLPRFTFGLPALSAGFSLLPGLVGLFAINEVLKAASSPETAQVKADVHIKGFGFSFQEFKQQQKNMVIAAAIGVGIGILPGIGGGTSNILAYGAVRSASKYPDKFGTGIIDGIVATETANNASIGGAMVPLLTLGIPGDTITAVLLGAFMVHGLQPGPMLFKTNGELIYAIFAALIVASVMMIIIEFLFMRGFIRLLTIPKYILLPIVMVLCTIGAFSTNNRIFDMWVLLIFGVIGVLLAKAGYPQAPVILGFILCPYVETYLRRGLQVARGNFWAFFKAPISGTFIVLALVVIALNVIKYAKMSATERVAVSEDE